jgi:hypothetical protein
MISRLTAYAACFAILSAATIVFAASTHAQQERGPVAKPQAVAPTVIQLPRVEIVGRRLPG